MSPEEIIRLAREAGAFTDVVLRGRCDGTVFSTAELERFAALVAAAEREECAKVCDKQHDRAKTSTGAARAAACAAAIRARGAA